MKTTGRNNFEKIDEARKNGSNDKNAIRNIDRKAKRGEFGTYASHGGVGESFDFFVDADAEMKRKKKVKIVKMCKRI